MSAVVNLGDGVTLEETWSDLGARVFRVCSKGMCLYAETQDKAVDLACSMGWKHSNSPFLK